MKYVVVTRDLLNGEDGPQTVYPDSPGMVSKRATALTIEDTRDDGGQELIPATVWKMYHETLAAFSANIRTLAAGGLRAVVEAICLDKQVPGANLQKKIDELATQGSLTKAEAELLHEERYLGNEALHELSTPSARDIEDGLEIVESLIRTLYILPSKAKRLRARRGGTP